MAALNEALLQQMQEQFAQMQTELAASAAAIATVTAAAALLRLPPSMRCLLAVPLH